MHQPGYLDHSRGRRSGAEHFLMRAREVAEAVECGNVDPRAYHALQPQTQPLQGRRDVADCLARLHVHLSAADELSVLVESGAARYRYPVARPHGAGVPEDWFPGRTTGDADDVVHRCAPPKSRRSRL